MTHSHTRPASKTATEQLSKEQRRKQEKNQRIQQKLGLKPVILKNIKAKDEKGGKRKKGKGRKKEAMEEEEGDVEMIEEDEEEGEEEMVELEEEEPRQLPSLSLPSLAAQQRKLNAQTAFSEIERLRAIQNSATFKANPLQTIHDQLQALLRK